jgi:hypothetical protein
MTVKISSLQNTLEKLYRTINEEGDIVVEEDSSPAAKKSAVKKYGNVAFADEKNKKYPLDKKHVHAAISYFGMPKNYKKYSDSVRKGIARRIAAAAEKLGIKVSDEWKKKHGI